MLLNGEITVKARRETVFNAVRNARFFASCIDGVNELTEIDASHYTAVVETKISFMKFKFNVVGHLVRIEPPHEIEAKLEGTPLGVLGRLTAVSVTTLTEIGDETRISYTVNMTLAGKLGSIGQSAFSAKANEMSKQFGDKLRSALQSQSLEAIR